MRKFDEAYSKIMLEAQSLFHDEEVKLGSFTLKAKFHIGPSGYGMPDQKKEEEDLAKVLETAEKNRVEVVRKWFTKHKVSEGYGDDHYVCIEASGLIGDLYKFIYTIWHYESIPYLFGQSLVLSPEQKADKKLLEKIELLLWLGSSGAAESFEEAVNSSYRDEDLSL